MPFAAAATLLRDAVAVRAFPAAVVEVGRGGGVLWREAFGALTFDEEAPHADEHTIFDLASLTKVIATATLAMRAIDTGALALDDRVADRLHQWRGDDRVHVTIQDLLEHASGLTAYLPFYKDHRGRAEFERAICTMPLEYAPRSQSIYSDLGFILLGFILEDATGRPLDRQFSDVFPHASADTASGPLTFNPPARWRVRTAPTEVDPWRGRLLQGEVHDENAWALGGVAGHTGLFGTAAAVGAFARRVLPPLKATADGEGSPRDQAQQLARPGTVRRFVTRSAVAGSSRALAWDTMLPTSSCGTLMSERAIGHTGFTGTSVWIDPDKDLYVALLTNRVHPTRDNLTVQSVRRALHDSVIKATADGPSS